MNISPSDTDVRQGFPAAGTIAAAQDQAGAQGGAQTGSTTGAQGASSAQDAGAGAQRKAPGQAEAAQNDPGAKTDEARKAREAQEAARLLSQQLNKSDTGLKIKVLDDEPHTIQVEVVDEKSNKVLRKIPQDELIKLSASIREMNGREPTGVIIDRPT